MLFQPSFLMLFSKQASTWVQISPPGSICCFVPQRHDWKCISPESQCLTHAKCPTDLFPSSPKRTIPAFRLYLNWEDQTYSATWEILLSLHLSGFIQHRRGLCWRTPYIYIHTGEDDRRDGASCFWTVPGSSCGIIYTVSTAKKCESFYKTTWYYEEEGWPNTKGLDILRNHSLWNVIDGEGGGQSAVR